MHICSIASTAFASAAALVLASTVCAAKPVSSEAQVYLHPCASGKGKPAELTPPQLYSVLVHHLNVPGEPLNEAKADESDVWDWLTTGKQAAEDGSDSAKQRTVILLSGMDGVDLDEVIPARLRNTHKLSSTPHLSSFDALFHSYGERFYAGAPGLAQRFADYFVGAAEGVEHALEGATDWLLGSGLDAVAQGKKALDQTDLVDQVSQPFYQSLRNLVSHLDTIGGNEQDEKANGAYQALRFDGLSDIKSAYGEESRQYQQAKHALRSLLQAAVEKMDTLRSSRPQALALIVVPHSDEAQSTLSKRGDPLFPFRSSLGETPFLRTREVNVGEARQFSSSVAPSKTPKPSDYQGKCFKSEDDLNKATKECSGHGKPVQSSKGGRKCFRCRCQKGKDAKGKLRQWTGEACQRVDIAKPYALLAVTTIALLLITLSSVYYLLSEGQSELPSVLAGISIPNKSQ